jgi:hypothetical protein
MSANPKNSAPDSLAVQLKSATQILELAAGDRAVLAELSVAERTRLLTAAREIF